MGSHGARSWLVNMYEALNKDKPTLAKEWFDEFRDFYHPSVVDALENGIFKISVELWIIITIILLKIFYILFFSNKYHTNVILN